MEKNKKIVTMSILIAIVALLIIILTLSFVIANQKFKKAHVENLIDPLASLGFNSYGGSIVNIFDGNSDNDDEDDDDEDTTSPNSISNLIAGTIGTDFITWLWDNPSDSDFKEVLIYLNGVHITNTSSESYNATGLNENTTYTITIHTTDYDGNINNTDINNTQTTGQSMTAPVITSIPNITMQEDTIHNTLDLDDYVTDSDNLNSELTWTFSGNTNIAISIDNSTHIITFTPNTNWNGNENITFRVEDPDSNFDLATINVNVTGEDDLAVWQSLSNQEINEDSNDGTIVYSDILSRVSDPDSPITLTIGSNSHFDIELNGNDLVINNLQDNWYGSEVITLNANGETANFILTVNQLLDDCIEICSWGYCYEHCE